jgi:hypothetical protein
MQVKMFSNPGDESQLESEINMWLKNNNNIEISHVEQSHTYDGKQFYTLVSIWYTMPTSQRSHPI